ncbi:uncharacterized [Tachysurus ichikawai]
MEVDYIKNGYFSHQVSAWVITEKCKQVLAVQAASECCTDVSPEPVVCRMQGDPSPDVLTLKAFSKLGFYSDT